MSKKISTLNKVPIVTDLKQMLARTTSLYPNNNAFLVKEDKKYQGITYKKFKQDIDAFGTALIDMGLENNFIGVIGENSYKWCVTYMAVACGVGTIVPLDKELSAQELIYLIKTSNITTLVFSKKYKNKINEIREKVNIKNYICMNSSTELDNTIPFNKIIKNGSELIAKNDKRYVNAQIDPDKLSVLLFTSGTTDIAKGVMLSHTNLVTEVMLIGQTVSVTNEDRVLSILPMHHTYECTCGFLTMIYAGGTIAFCEGLRHISKNIKEVSPTMLILVPLILENIYNKIMAQAASTKLKSIIINFLMSFSGMMYKIFKIDIRKKVFKKVHQSFGGDLRVVISGASALAPKVSESFYKMGIKVLQGYGLTECAPIAIGNRENDFKHGSIGLPLPTLDIRLNEKDEKGIGEILVKGKNVMLGYFNNEEATNAVLKDGWLYTGDLGKKDKDGFYYITGRKKNLIVTKNGKNIFPEELESLLNESPYILESMVTGEEDDINKEDVVHASIVPQIEKIKESLKKISITDSDIFKIISAEVKKINKDLPIFKKIKNFNIKFDEFEKTTTKKIKRHLNKTK